MNIRNLISLLVVALMACPSCSKGVPDLQNPVSAIRRYVDSFAGLSLEATRTKLAGGKLSEEEWKGEGFMGTQLVASFPDYQVRVFLVDDKVIKTSIQILSK